MPTLGTFIDGYFAGRSNIKPTTLVNLKGDRRHLVNYFGSNRRLDTITPGYANEFYGWLLLPKPVLEKLTGRQTGEKRLQANTIPYGESAAELSSSSALHNASG